MKIDGNCALITGASAGIGREFARQLAPRAGSLVLVARRLDRLETLREELITAHPKIDVRLRQCDLAEIAQVDSLTRWLHAERISVDLLINNAGLGDRGAFLTSDPRRVQEMTMVNIVALTRLTRALLPAMVERKRGGILNVSSSASFLPMPTFAVYAATKAYVTSFSEALRAEVRQDGIAVCALCPGPVLTEFGEVAGRPGETYDSGPAFTHVAVEKVVSDAIAALEADRPIVVPGLAMKIGMTIVRLTPMPLLRFAAGFAAKRR